MTNIYFEETMRDAKRHVVDNVALGALHGYPYSITLETAGATPLLVLRFALEDGPAKAVVAKLKAAKASHIRWFTDGDILAAAIQPPTDFFAQADIHTALHSGTKALKEEGQTPPLLCPLCGLPHCDSYAFWDEANRPVHTACIENRVTLPPKDETYTPTPKGSYVLGAIGALIGAFIGALPNIVQATNKGKLSAILYAFIPLFSGLVYRLLRGKQNNTFASLSVLISSVLVVLALEQVGFHAYIESLWNIPVTYEYSIRQYFITNNFATAVKRMLPSLLLLVVGLFPTARLVRGYADVHRIDAQVIRGGDFVRSSVNPLQPHSSELPQPENN